MGWWIVWPPSVVSRVVAVITPSVRVRDVGSGVYQEGLDWGRRFVWVHGASLYARKAWMACYLVSVSVRRTW